MQGGMARVSSCSCMMDDKVIQLNALTRTYSCMHRTPPAKALQLATAAKPNNTIFGAGHFADDTNDQMSYTFQ